MSKQQLRVAIVHDWLYGGGAELVVEQLHKMYPEAPIYTSYCSPEWRERLNNKVVTGYLQHWPFSQLRKFLPVLRQRWFKRLDLSKFDLVISSSGNGEAKFALSSKRQEVKSKKSDAKHPVHICYCHTPTHFYWRKYEEYLKNPSFRPRWLARLGLRVLVKPLRKRDYQAAQRVDHFIANSSHIQKDIKKYYNRDSMVIHPPIDIENWKIGNRKEEKPRHGFIMWGRHVPYKRFDLAIEACNQLKLPLTIVGTGPETARLQRTAGPTVTFAGFATNENLQNLAANAAAFIFPSEEDFGISPVEAMAAGLPVIAYKAGGALDYIIEGETGVFFSEQTVDSLKEGLQKYRQSPFDATRISKTALRFSSLNFRKEWTSFLSILERR